MPLSYRLVLSFKKLTNVARLTVPESAIFPRSLLSVTRFAKRLQVPPVEPLRVSVSLMRDDVIDVVRRDESPVLLALTTDRLFAEHELPETAPV
jgi:hypothetical protein